MKTAKKKLSSHISFSKKHLGVFVALFALIGGAILWSSYAAPAPLLARPALLPQSIGTVKNATPSTLASLFSGANPGDQIILGVGDYTQFVEISRSGTASAPITISGVTSGANFKGRIKVTGDYIRIIDMNFIGRTCPETQDVMIYVAGASYVDMLRLNIRDTNHSAIYVGDPGAKADHINLAYSQFRNIGCKDNLDHPAYFGSVTSGWIGYNLFLGGKGYGAHLYPDADSILVEHNTSTGHDKSGYIVAGSGSFSENNEFRDNISYGNGHWGFRAYANGTTPTRVTNNLGFNNGLKPPAGYPAGDVVYNFPSVAIFGQDVAGGLDYYDNTSGDPKLDVNYRPLTGSPAIGRATDGTDIGAIQTGSGTNPPPSPPPPTPSPTPSPSPAPSGKIGDLNGDNRVDIYDLSILLNNYGQ